MSHYKPEDLAAMSRFLKDANFPATRKSIMELAVERGAPERSLEALAKIPDRDYIHMEEVIEEIGSMHK
ncbi:MAG: DUF2795 domain-containing protein [Oceanidesulfovibrio sp.]